MALKIEDLEFRFYNGEKECPNFATANEKRWWDQERSVAGGDTDRALMAIEDFETRPKEEWPKDVLDADASDGSKAVALSGYLNTKQWDTTGDVVSNFEGYFEHPVGPFKVGSAVKE